MPLTASIVNGAVARPNDDGESRTMRGRTSLYLVRLGSVTVVSVLAA